MKERPRIGNDWSKALTKGRGKSIAAKLESFSTADEVIDWSVDQYRALGLAGLALAFSYVANNPGQVVSENHELTFNFKSAIQTKPSRILKKIKIGTLVNLVEGFILPEHLNEQQVVVAKSKGTITLADKTNRKYKIKSTPEELTDNLTVSLRKNEGEKTEGLLIQERINFLFNGTQEKYIPLLNLNIRNVDDINEHRKELKQILIKLDPSLRRINNHSKDNGTEIKLIILQYLKNFERMRLNVHDIIKDKKSPKDTYLKLRRVFLEVITENNISTDWSTMTGQNGELILHELIYVLRNLDTLEQQNISRTDLLLLLSNYLYIDSQRNNELLSRML